jgi:hypothetical protein
MDRVHFESTRLGGQAILRKTSQQLAAVVGSAAQVALRCPTALQAFFGTAKLW